MDIAALIWAVVDICIAGFVVYIAQLLLAKLPMDATFKQVAFALVCLVAVLILVAILTPLFSGLGHGGLIAHRTC